MEAKLKKVIETSRVQVNRERREKNSKVCERKSWKEASCQSSKNAKEVKQHEKAKEPHRKRTSEITSAVY